MYRKKAKPSDEDIDCVMFGFSCEYVKKVYESYRNYDSLDYAEIEAELNENAGENSEYWFNAPVFY